MEVWEGHPATAAGDQYALGVTAFVALTGTLPAGSVMTTNNVEEADFTGNGFTDANNDFGFIRALDFDWGDLPDPVYATLAASNGPNHEITSPVTGELHGDVPEGARSGDRRLAPAGPAQREPQERNRPSNRSQRKHGGHRAARSVAARDDRHAAGNRNDGGRDDRGGLRSSRSGQDRARLPAQHRPQAAGQVDASDDQPPRLERDRRG